MRTRDMTRREFKAKLAHYGLRQELLWIVGADKDGHTTGIGMVMTNRGGRGWKTNYRASLAKAIRETVR